MENKEKVMSEMNELSYSLILYFTELLEEDIESIKDYIKKGITIHLFLTNTLQEELELNEYDLDIFDNEIDNKLLFIYENQEQIIDNNEVIAVDGTIKKY